MNARSIATTLTMVMAVSSAFADSDDEPLRLEHLQKRLVELAEKSRAARDNAVLLKEVEKETLAEYDRWDGKLVKGIGVVQSVKRGSLDPKNRRKPDLIAVSVRASPTFNTVTYAKDKDDPILKKLTPGTWVEWRGTDVPTGIGTELRQRMVPCQKIKDCTYSIVEAPVKPKPKKRR